MQGLADGYFVLPYTLANYLADDEKPGVAGCNAMRLRSAKSVQKRLDTLVGIQGKRSVESFHRELGLLLLDKCGMSRSKEETSRALGRIRNLRDEFWSDVRVPVAGGPLNQELEKASACRRLPRVPTS